MSLAYHLNTRHQVSSQHKNSTSEHLSPFPDYKYPVVAIVVSVFGVLGFTLLVAVAMSYINRHLNARRDMKLGVTPDPLDREAAAANGAKGGVLLGEAINLPTVGTGDDSKTVRFAVQNELVETTSGSGMKLRWIEVTKPVESWFRNKFTDVKGKGPAKALPLIDGFGLSNTLSPGVILTPINEPVSITKIINSEAVPEISMEVMSGSQSENSEDGNANISADEISRLPLP